jgi:hypothetical protein
MAEINATNPGLLARQTREEAVRLAEENYRKAQDTAVRARENARHEAMVAKAEAIKQAKAALEQPRRRLNDAHDRVEAKLRKQELDKIRDEQEAILIKAENTRVKALKRANELGKRLAVEAIEARRHAIQQAYDNEKTMKLEIQQALKTQKAAERTRVEDERKARRKAELEASQSLKSQKATARAQQVIEKSKQETEESRSEKLTDVTPQEVPIPVAKPETAKLVANPESVKLMSQPEPVILVASPEPVKLMANAKTGRDESLSPRSNEDKQHGMVKANTVGPAASRSGVIKLVIAQQNAVPEQMIDFENSLRKIADIRLVMIGGTVEGVQIIVSSEKSIALSDILRQLPMVQEITDQSKDILVKLKPLVIPENDIESG